MIKKILFFIVIMEFFLYSFAYSWHYAIYPGNYFAYRDVDTQKFYQPGGVTIWYLDPVQIVLDDPKEVIGLQQYVRKYIANLQNGGPLEYVPNRRDCDDFACILKGQMAYYGFGNLFGVMLDWVKAHAVDVFWYDPRNDGNATLMVIEPQNGKVYKCPNDWANVIW